MNTENTQVCVKGLQNKLVWTQINTNLFHQKPFHGIIVKYYMNLGQIHEFISLTGPDEKFMSI